jgi:polyhydroxyalkanoate synthesis repressor PhaR
VIKRYSNRKLYNTTTRRYITLEEIADLISEGEDVRVVDHASGNDMTTLTLAQVLFELEKQPGGLFPGVMFEKIIKSGQSNLQAYRKAIQALVNPKLMINDEIIHRLDVLKDSGRISQEEHDYWKILLVEKLPEEPVSANPNSSEMIDQIEAKITDLERELFQLQNPDLPEVNANNLQEKA